MARFTNHSSVSQFDFVLTNATNAVAGEIAVGDPATGKVKPAVLGTNLRAIGFFTETMTGDGTSTVGVQLFAEKQAYLCGNDGTNPVAFAFANVYFASGSTVSSLATGNSIAGWALQVSSAGVLCVF